MNKAQFVFHGLFFDKVQQPGVRAPRVQVVFDVEVGGQFLSHQMADIEVMDHEGTEAYRVQSSLPFACPDFPAAAVQYLEFISGPQQAQVSPSGPKGPSLLTPNVVRAEWAVELEVTTDPPVR
jgi:hypothetical protein